MKGIILFVGMMTLILLPSCMVRASYVTQRYQNTERVPVLVNTIGPYRNPAESYEFYSLPFCKPPLSRHQHRHETIGEQLEGDHLEMSLYDIRFQVDVEWQPVCSLHLKVDEVEKFRDAIKKDYYYSLRVDDIPVGAFVGTVRTDPDGGVYPVLFNHLNFKILYNGDRVIYPEVSADTENVIELRDVDGDLYIEFSFSVTWEQSDVSFENRMKFLLGDKLVPNKLEIHWISIINSSVLVMLLCGFVAIIIQRTLNMDYDRYTLAKESGDDSDEYGWKTVSSEVFRSPSHPEWYCALVGVGAQLLVLTVLGLVLALLGLIDPLAPGGEAYTVGIVLYSWTSAIAGFVSRGLYKYLGPKNKSPRLVALYSAMLFTLPYVVVSLFLNMLAQMYHTTYSLPMDTVVTIAFIYLGMGLPQVFIGAAAADKYFPDCTPPYRAHHFERIIPEVPVQRSFPVQVIVGGFLPFSGIYIELHYLFGSIWGHNPYHLYGILGIVFLLLLMVTSCVTIAFTYFQLSAENYLWWWRSFATGSATAGYIFLYALYFYFVRSNMYGKFQLAFYFGRVLLLVYYFGIMLGAIGSTFSFKFVRHIYSKLKAD